MDNEKQANSVAEMSLWEVLATKRIVVPVIQRDYAQGRESQFAKNVRERFVERLYEAVQEENGNPLCMDFVYFEKDGDKLIPVDGQQRLTTLWLFHVYHLAQENEEITKRLKRFSYEVRQTSRAFCKKLVERRHDWYDELTENDTRTCKETICNQPWFFTAWRRDPTIMGMIRMLDTIHAKGQGKTLADNWWEGEYLTFLDYTTQEKDLYCKMNARGKLLTPFENLKAAIDERAPDDSTWKSAVDGTWLNKVWEIVGNKGCDRAMFRLTLTLLLLHYIERDDEAATEKASVIDNVRETIKDSDVALPAEDWERLMEGKPIQFLKEGFSWLVCVPSEQEDGKARKSWYPEDINTWWYPIWESERQDPSENVLLTALANESTGSDPLSYEGECLAYAYILAKSEPAKLKSKIEPRDWWRIIHNILENTAISSANLDSVIKLIHSLAEAEDLVTALENTSVAKEQCKEEAEKLKLLSEEDENWRDSIEKAEALPWQKGRINFLLCQCNEGIEDNPSDKLDKFNDVLDHFLKRFKDEESRLAWINQIWNRVETYCRNNNENTNNRFFVPRYICRENEWSELKRFLYWKEWNNWQRPLLYKGIPLKNENDKPVVMDPVPLKWLSRLKTVLVYYNQHPDPKNKIPTDSNLANRLGSLQRYKDNEFIYLFVNDNITNAICLDDIVDWWFKLYKEHKDWNWRWLTADHGTWISTTGDVGGGKHTFALIQRGEESRIQLVDEGNSSEEKLLKDTSPEEVIKGMKKLVEEAFLEEKEV